MMDADQKQQTEKDARIQKAESGGEGGIEETDPSAASVDVKAAARDDAKARALRPENASSKKPQLQLNLILDDRELRSPAARALFSLGVKLQPRRLEVADFIISEQIAIERKTAADFEASIMDGRLFQQCKDLNANFPFPLLCIIGREFSRLHQRALIGAQIAVATEFRIPIFRFEDDEEFAQFIHILLVQKAKGKKDMKLRFEKKALSKDGQLQLVIEGIPMIGPVHAKNLLRKFKTLQKIFSASEKALQKVEGIGELRAKQVRQIATAIYGEDDKEQRRLNDASEKQAE